MQEGRFKGTLTPDQREPYERKCRIADVGYVRLGEEEKNAYDLGINCILQMEEGRFDALLNVLTPDQLKEYEHKCRIIKINQKNERKRLWIESEKRSQDIDKSIFKFGAYLFCSGIILLIIMNLLKSFVVQEIRIIPIGMIVVSFMAFFVASFRY